MLYNGVNIEGFGAGYTVFYRGDEMYFDTSRDAKNFIDRECGIEDGYEYKLDRLELTDTGTYLFDGGWRSGDGEQIKTEYDLSDDEAEIVLDRILDLENQDEVGKIEKIADILDDMDPDEVIRAWNEYLYSASTRLEEAFHPMDTLDEYLEDQTPTNIILSVGNNHFDVDDSYFIDGIYGLESVDSIKARDRLSWDDISAIAEWIVSSGNDLENEEIRAALNK